MDDKDDIASRQLKLYMGSDSSMDDKDLFKYMTKEVQEEFRFLYGR